MPKSLFVTATLRLASPSPLRSLIVLAVVALVTLIGACIYASQQLLDEFNTVEESSAQQRAALVLQAYKYDTSKQLMSNRDYAEWDSAAHYIDDHNSAFVVDNFPAETLQGLNIDVVMIRGPDGTLLHSAYLDRNAQQLRTPAPASLLAALTPYASKAVISDDLPITDRIVPTELGTAVVTAREITHANRTQPTGATMLFARFIQDDELARYRSTTQLDAIGMTTLVHGQPAAGAALPAAVSGWYGAATGDDKVAPLVMRANDRMVSYVLLRTPEKQPALLLSVSERRGFYAAGFRTTWVLLGSIVAITLAFGTALLALVLRLHRSYAAHQSIENRYRNIAAQVGESILLIDAYNCRVIDANDAVLSVLGVARDQLITRVAADIYPDLTPGIIESARAEGAGRVITTSRMRRADGSESQNEISITQLQDAGKELLCLVGHDISHRMANEEQQKANQKRLLHLAQHDPLTGLPNRLYLRARLPRVLKHAGLNDHSLALVYLDVDHFKNINDSRGHDFGDKLLQIVAQRLRNTVGTRDAVVRMGGDEFVIVASLRSQSDALDDMAERLQEAVSAPISIDGDTLTVTASIGVSVYPQDGLDLEVLLKHADIALYQAKEAGRNCHRLFVADMDLRVSEDVALEQALRHAIGTDQLYMEYQPVVDLRTSRVTSFEALMRWRHPELGVVPPGRFVPIAEKSGVILQLGQHAIEQTLKQLRAWLDEGIACVPIAVNVAPQQLMRTDFPTLVKELADAAVMEAAWLRFEITESALLKNTEQMIETLTELRRIGCQVLIDDFGTGYSALSYLTQLPVDALKIDRSFVVDLAQGEASAQVIRAVLDMGRRLKIATVAEGVETKEQALLLRKLGCNYAQGFLFSRPLSPRRARILLERRRARMLADETAAQAREEAAAAEARAAQALAG
jgi:diguanylate cyclase (GGDEF)-like protein/PAS domain S-box-containing protein